MNATSFLSVRHTYWAPLNPVTEALHAVSWLYFCGICQKVWPNTAFLCCNHQSTCMPSYSFHVQLLWYPMYYPGGMKARVSPVQWSEPHSILAPFQDSNPGGRIQNHDHYTTTAHDRYRALSCSVVFWVGHTWQSHVTPVTRSCSHTW